MSVLPSALLHSLDKTAVEAERCRRSFRLFIERAWSVIEPHTTFIPGWHIDCIADHLEAVARGDIRDLLINIPPRHMKSLAVAVFWPAWLWTQRPGTRFLCASYSLHLSTRDSVRCRRRFNPTMVRLGHPGAAGDLAPGGRVSIPLWCD